ncbi:MAG: Tn3 family transposase [Burkholderiaceae bacterium]|nr:Tn3 family transposase [Burkholderiaceae bacterium]
MPSFYLRFVGSDTLPKSLSKREVEESFGLSVEDIDALRPPRFRGTARLGAAVQLVMLRATGRHPDAFSGLPPVLLRHLTTTLGMSATDIASVTSLYKDKDTRFAHQLWAREHSGFTVIEDTTKALLADALGALAATAVSVDDLVHQAEHWLFDRRLVLPGDRTLRDLARAAYASQEKAAIEAISAGVPRRQLLAAMAHAFSKRSGPGGQTVLEWLRTPPGKHGQLTLTEVTKKIECLKALQVHEWNLSLIPLNRLKAYSQEVVNRAPSATKALSDVQRELQMVCFLHVILLEQTDLAAEIGARRLTDLYRKASGKVLKKQAKGSVDLRAERVKLKEILYDRKMTATQIVAAMRELLPNDESDFEGTRAQLIRETLVKEDAPRVSALLNSLGVLEVKGDESDKALLQLKLLRDLAKRGENCLPEGFDVSVADQGWHSLLQGEDRKVALAALKASAATSLRKAIKGGRIWLGHSCRHRSRADQLIPEKEWAEKSKSLIRALSLTDDPDKLLDRVLGRVKDGMAQLAKAVEDGTVTVDNHGHIHIAAIEALEIEPQVSKTRENMFNTIGNAQFGNMLVEIDAKTGFSQALLGRMAKDIGELKAVYGALYAQGTENNAKGVCAMIPEVQVSQITVAMRAMEATGRLRDANTRVVDFQQSMPISKLWGQGDKASSDSMTLDTSRYLHSARVEHRRKQHGVGIYVHMLDTWALFHDQPIVINDRQAAPAVHGVEAHNCTRREDQIRLSLLAVDTHGYTNAAMAIAKLLGFDLCVRLRQLSERKMFLAWGDTQPEALERLVVGKVSLKKIRAGWMELLRLIASIRQGRLTAGEAIARLGSAAKGDPVHAAADELGKLLRTIFLCDYFTIPEFRREMHALLNRGESVHLLQRAVYHGRVGVSRARRTDELRAISTAHTLLTNVVIAWNTMKMQDVVDHWKSLKLPIEDSWLRRMGPVHFEHVNFKGIINFEIDPFFDALVQRQPKQRSRHA